MCGLEDHKATWACDLCGYDYRYCSKCERAQCAIHQLMCADIVEHSKSPRPSDKHIRAVVFPSKSTKPRFIWLTYNSIVSDNLFRGNEGQHKLEVPNIRKGLRMNDPLSSPPIRSESILKHTRGTIHICYLNAPPNGEKNNSITTVAAIGDGNENKWSTSVLALAIQDRLRNPLPRDLDMYDYHYIADYLLHHGPKHRIATCWRTFSYKAFFGITVLYGLTLVSEFPDSEGDIRSLVFKSVSTLSLVILVVIGSLVVVSITVLVAVVGVASLSALCSMVSSIARGTAVLLFGMSEWPTLALMKWWRGDRHSWDL